MRKLICTVQSIESWEGDNYDNLAKRIAQHASKLSQQDNQVRATLAASHLFVTSQSKESKYCTACVGKATNIVNSIENPESIIPLFVEILDTLIVLFTKYPEVVEQKHLNSTIETIQKHLNEKQVDKGSSLHYQNIKNFILFKQDFKNLIPQQVEGPPDCIPVNTIQISKSEAKKESEKWSTIVINKE